MQNDNFYKYITVTDQTSGNLWTFEYVRTDSGKPIYKFNQSVSDLTKDNASKPGGKDWSVTGKQPEYTVTVNPETGKIEFVSAGDVYAATAKGSSGTV